MTRASVIVVEDETVTAMALTESVERMGYDVVATLDSGEAAVKAVREHHVDVVLMDIHLRGAMDGIQAAEIIRKETQVPCVYLTAYSDEQTLRRARVAEPYGYIVKPYNEKELRAAIEIAVHNSALERDRLAAQEAVEARDRLLADIVDHSPSIIYLKDADERYTLVNQRFEAAFGLARADVKGKDDVEVLPPEVRSQLTKADAEVLHTGASTHGEVEIPGPDGLPRNYVADRFPVRRSGSAITGVCCVLTDFTDSKRTQAKLRESEALYRLITETSLDVITLSDAKGIIAYVSPSCQKLLGFAPEELKGTQGYALVHPDDLARVREMPPPSSGAWVGAPITFRLRTAKGAYVWVEATLQSFPRSGGQGEPMVLSVTREVGERLEAQREIQRLNQELENRVAERTRQLERVNQQLEGFTRSVSHDLRAPVRGIRMLAEELHEEYGLSLDEHGNEVVEKLRAESERLGTLISELLQFTRASEGLVKATRVDVSALAELVVQDLRKREPERVVDVRVAPGLVAHGDALLLRIVLENLIGNAWKFTAKTPAAQIRVGAEPGAEGKPVFYVRDNGAGFEPSAGRRLFQPFQRLHQQEDFPGTGLGLSSVRNIIERHGGRVWAEGKPGQGAVFWFTL